VFREKSGQFEPFKLLIGAITALLILTIIVSTINYFQGLEVDISTERFYSAVKNAVNQANGSLLVAENVVLTSGSTISSRGLAQQAGFQDQCIVLQADNPRVFLVDVEGKKINVLERVQTEVYVQCYSNTSADAPNPSECQISCKVSLGSKPT
jgi:hypothetical protein